MVEIRNFIIACTSTLGLLELTDSGDLLANESEPTTLFIKAVITLIAGLLTTTLTRLIKNFKENKRSKANDQKTNESKKQ